MKYIVYSIMLVAVVCSIAFADETDAPNRICIDFQCADLYSWIAADAIMALPDSADAALISDDRTPEKWKSLRGSGGFAHGASYTFCMKKNYDIFPGHELVDEMGKVKKSTQNISKCNWYEGYGVRWEQGTIAARKVILMFESEGISINSMGDVPHFLGYVIDYYGTKKKYGGGVSRREFNDNSSLSIEENIINAIVVAKKSKEEWYSRKNERETTRKEKEEAEKAEHLAKINKIDPEFPITKSGYKNLPWGMSLEDANNVARGVFSRRWSTNNSELTLGERAFCEVSVEDIVYDFKNSKLNQIFIYSNNKQDIEECNNLLRTLEINIGKRNLIEKIESPGGGLYRRWNLGNTIVEYGGSYQYNDRLGVTLYGCYINLSPKNIKSVKQKR